MSPEQATDPNKVDIRADIYSLGVTLFEMLTGTKPYSGTETVDILKQIFNAPVPDPRKRNPQITKSCSHLIMKMMAKKKEDRHPDAESLNRDLKALLSGNKILSEAESGLEKERIRLSGFDWKKKISSAVHNHWFLCGMTAGIIFFILALGTAVLAVGVFAPEILAKFLDGLTEIITNIID